MIDFASWVVALLAARRLAADMVLRPDLLARLVENAGDGDEAPLTALMRDMLREKIPLAAVSDLYIPAAAAQLGRDWMDDRKGFAEVTLASARLQAMQRAIAAAWSADLVEGGGNACLLLAVAPGEQHTLGALVLAGQLRRMGVSVRLALGPDEAELAALFGAIRFDGMLLSVAAEGGLAFARRFVRSVRALGPPGLPVVVGGGVMAMVPDAAARIGADAAASDIDRALAACGIGSVVDARPRRYA